ncbi:MAG: hypothetical protein JNL70_17645 [Saprospiraceae bacterium]|nr:hypothetical protein [Saprospiraceae bacterium]
MKKQYFIIFLFFCATKAICQDLLPPLEHFSSKKQAYLIKKDSTRIDFFLTDLDRKKGLIVNVEGKTTEGKKFEIKADQILTLAVPPSDLSKFIGISESTRSVAKLGRTNTNKLNRDLVYFFQEYAEDRKVTALLQLLNPDFSDKIAIYHDPWATETMGFGVAGIPITGGIDKSYYLKVNGKTKRYFKKDYDDEFEKLFKSCPELLKKYKNFAWRDLPRHVYFFDTECE